MDCILTQIIVTSPENVSVVYTPQFGIPVPALGTTPAIILTKLAQGNLSGHMLVRDTSATQVGYVDTTVLANGDDVTGITMGAALDGAPISIMAFGDMTEPGWSWAPLAPIFATGSGLLTQTPPSSPAVFALAVGYATSPTSMRIRIGIPIVL